MLIFFINKYKIHFVLKVKLQSKRSGQADKLTSVRNLYDNYGAALLGYIYGIVKNYSTAEHYLIEVFKEVPLNLEEYSESRFGTLCHLQLIARKKLSTLFENINNQGVVDSVSETGDNKFIEQMTPDQRHVFCGLHYSGKTIAVLAAELNRPEETVKRILKDSFTHIRKGEGYAGLH